MRIESFYVAVNDVIICFCGKNGTELCDIKLSARWHSFRRTTVGIKHADTGGVSPEE